MNLVVFEPFGKVAIETQSPRWLNLVEPKINILVRSILSKIGKFSSYCQSLSLFNPIFVEGRPLTDPAGSKSGAFTTFGLFLAAVVEVNSKLTLLLRQKREKSEEISFRVFSVLKFR